MSGQRNAQLLRVTLLNMPDGIACGQFHQEHGSLVTEARKLISHLQSLGDRIRCLDDTSYGHHDKFALRAKSIASYLEGALQLAEHGLYLPALAVVRSTFEHHFIDRLMMLAQKDRVPITHGSGEDAGYGISLRYFFSNTPRDILLYQEGGEHMSEPQFWKDWFSVQVLGKTLVTEGLLSREASRMWEAHYSFLCRYTHPVSSAEYEDLFGDQVGGYHHCASELVLLYICYFGAASLQDFHAMSKLPPKFRLEGWEDVAQDIATTEALIEHAWFPGQQPHERDRYNEALRRYGEVLDKTGEDDVSITANSIEDADVQYYTDPLQRLRDLHQSSLDVVGAYDSPWEQR